MLLQLVCFVGLVLITPVTTRPTGMPPIEKKTTTQASDEVTDTDEIFGIPQVVSKYRPENSTKSSLIILYNKLHSIGDTQSNMTEKPWRIDILHVNSPSNLTETPDKHYNDSLVHVMFEPATTVTMWEANGGKSPITLMLPLSRLNRLILVAVLAVVGTILNVFFISAFFVEESLRKVGNTFLSCLGLADLMVTSVVFPISAVVLMTGEGNNVITCRLQQILFLMFMHMYMIFFTLLSAENQIRICHVPGRYRLFTSMRVRVVVPMVVFVSFGFSTFGTLLGMEYDYCERKSAGNLLYRVITATLFFIIPCLLTIYFLITATIRIRKRAKEVRFRRSHQLQRDLSQLNVNIIVYFVFLASWSPYIVTIYNYPNIENEKFYLFSWLGLLRSVFSCIIYIICNDSYRRAYANLFEYCCCKGALSGAIGQRDRRTIGRYPVEIRTHIMLRALPKGTLQHPSSL